MADINITVASNGVDEATKRMNDAASAADKLDNKVEKLGKTSEAASKKISSVFKALDEAAKSAAPSLEDLFQAYQKLENQIQQNVVQNSALANAMRTNTSAVNNLTSAQVGLNSNLSSTQSNLAAVDRSQRSSNESMREAHALARGLSGSFGALWVTYGNIAGMSVGLAIGQALKGIVSVGRDVESTLEGIRVRGNETVDSVNEIRKSVEDLGKGVYGPQEVAKAFETLILAGLNANQALSAINSTMNLAVAGGTSLEKSASTLVSVGTSIGYVAEGYNRVGDVISKTAALSMSSVETLSEAFKSASSVASLYGVTLEDIGTSLGVLSNLGIQGSAAGTALKNMYKELNSEADKVQKTFKELGLTQLSFKDSAGNFKPLLEVVKELDASLKQLSGSDEKLAIARLSNERGLRLITAALDQYRVKTSESTNALEDFQGNVTDSYGFMAKAAVQMSLTADNQMKMVTNSMKTGFASAFETIQPEIISVSSRLKEAFQSEGFKEALRSLALLFANMAEAIASNLPVVIKLAEAFVALKAGFIVAAVWQSAATGILAVREAMLGLATASAAVNATMGAVAVVVGVAAAAWYAYSSAQEDANKAQKDAIDYSKGYIEGIRAEADNLEKVNEKLREGIALKDVQKKVESDNSRLLQIQKENDAVEEARKNLEKANEAATKYSSQNNIDKMIAAREALAAAEEHQRQSAINAFDEELRLNRLAKENAELVLQAQKNAQSGRDEPTKTLSHEDKTKAMGLSAIEAEISAIRASSEEKRRILISEEKLYEETYRGKMMSVLEYADKESKVLKARQDLVTETYAKEVSAILVSENLKGRTETERNELAKKRSDLYTKWVDDIAKLNDAMSANEVLVSSVFKKERDEAQATSDKVIEAIKKRTASVQAQVDAYNSLPDSVRKAGVTEKQLADEVAQAQIDALKRKRATLEELSGSTMYDADAIARYTRNIQEMEDERDVLAARELQRATNKNIQDYNTAWKQSNKQIGDDIANAIIDGGGKGWKKLVNDMKLAFAKLILNPIIAPISAELASLTAIANPSSASAAEGTSSVGMLSSAMNIYKAVSGGFSSLSSSAASGMQSVQNMLGERFGGTGAGAGNSTGAFANSFGEIAGKAAGFAIGQTLNKSLSGEFQVGSGFGKVETIATAVASYFGPQFGAIAGAVSGLVNKLFGMGSKNISSQGISGNITEDGVTGQAYANWSQKGGWFRSDKSGTDTSALSADVINSFQSGLTSLKAASTDFAKNVNVSADALNNYSKSFDIQFVGLKEVKGTAAEQAAIIESNSKIQQEAVTKFFTTMGDDMATKLIPNIADFAKNGETASVTLQRLSSTFTATNQIAAILGKSVESVFGGIGLESDKTRERLIDLAGGLSNLQSKTTAYATAFLSDSEKLAPVQKALSAAMENLGQSSVTTKDQFKAVVNSLDLTTDAGATLFNNLMDIAPAFAQVADAAEAAQAATRKLQIALLEAQGENLKAQSMKREDELKPLSDSDKVIQQQIYAAQDKAITDKLLLSLMQAQGDAQGALAVTRANELKQLSETDQLIQKQIYDAEDKAKTEALTLTLLQAQGKVSEALNITRAKELASLSESDQVIQRQIYALEDKAKIDKLNLSLTQAQGNAQDALAITRANELAQMTDAEKVIQQQIYLTEDKAKTDSLSLALLQAQGKAQEALNITRDKELAALSDSDKVIQKQIYAAQDAAKIASLQIQLVTALSGAQAALSLTRAKEVEGLSAQEAAMKATIYAAQDAAVSDRLGLELITAQGRAQEALTITRNNELAALSESDKLIKQQTYAAQDKAKTDSLNIALLQAQGKVQDALFANRVKELSVLSDSDKAIQQQIYAAEDKANSDKLDIELMQAQGKSQEALNITRQNELNALSKSEQVIQQQIYDAQDKAKTDALNLALLQEQGKAQEALAVTRANELASLSDTDKAIKQQIYAAQDKAKTDALALELINAQGYAQSYLAATRAKELESLNETDKAIKQQIYTAQDKAKTDALLVTLLQAQGKAQEALTTQREKELSTMSDSDQVIQKQIYAAQDKAKIDTLNVDLLQAQGKAQEYLAATRAKELFGLSEEEKAIKQKIYASQDAAKTAALELELVKQQGLDYKALLITREQELSQLSESDQVIQKQIYRQQDLNTLYGLNVKLLDAQYRSQESVNMQREKTLAGLSAEAAVLQKAIYAAQDAQKAVDTGMTKLTASVNAQKAVIEAQYKQASDMLAAQKKAATDAAQSSIDASKTSLSSIQSIQSSLSGALKDVLDSSTVLTLKVRNNALAALQGISGSRDLNSPAMMDAIKTLAKPSEQLYSNLEDYTRSQMQVANTIDNLNSQAVDQVSLAQQSVDLQEANLKVLTQWFDSQQASLDQQHTNAVAEQDAILKNAQDQIDALRNIDNSVLSVEQAVSDLAIAIANAKATTISYAPASNLLDVAQKAVSSTYPSLDVGTNALPSDMTINAHAGERIIPAADNREIMRRLEQPENGSSAEMVQSIESLKETVRAGQIATLQLNQQMYRLWKKFDQDGMPEVRDVEAIG